MQPRSIFKKKILQHLQIVQYQKSNSASENKEIKIFLDKGQRARKQQAVSKMLLLRG